MSIRAPWWVKIAAKTILSRLPLSYRRLADAGMFRHGDMEDVAYAMDVFQHHAVQAGVVQRPSGGDTHSLEGKVCLELGPGDGLSSALIAHAHGAARCFLVDAGDFANQALTVYQRQCEQLAALGLPVPDLAGCADTSGMLEQIGGCYLTSGLQSLQGIPDASVDFIWSHAVLEHVRLHEFDATLAELKRILKPGGVASHRVDLQDHLDHSLNNLRFRESTWERGWVANSGFYTNRIRFTDMQARFEMAGYAFEVSNVDRWSELPLARGSLDSRFADLPDEELRVQGFDVVMRHTD